MQTQTLPNLIPNIDADFSLGANSFTDPFKLPQGQYAWGENIINRGGEIGTRQGFFNLLKFNCGRSQGIALFRPSNTYLPNLYMAISGTIWMSRYPFTTAEQLPGIQFRPDLDQVTFQVALVANTPSMAISPYLVLIMQDGITRPAYTDGTISKHLDPTPNGFSSPFSTGARETRIGLAMEFIGLRLWVADGRQLFASDVGDPLHFIETTYLAGGGSFQAYDGDFITCLKRTPDAKTLLAGTIANTTAFNAGNTDRASWATDPSFEQILFPGVGWTGPKCASSINAELFWMSQEGCRFYNSVGSAAFSARRPISSHEMKRSFDNRGPVLNRVCAGSFGPYGMLGVPSGDQYNRHIWAIDTSSSDLLTASQPYAWQPIWKGIRPVEFASGFVNGEFRCFCLEQGRDIPRVWELFYRKKRDYYMLGGIPTERAIQWRFESRGLIFKELFAFKRFSYSDLHLKDVLGVVKLTLEFKNEYGCFSEIGNWTFCTTECLTFTSCKLDPVPESQARYAKSQEAPAVCGQGGPPYQNNIGTFFTLRLKGEGEASVRGIYSFALNFNEITKGACQTGDKSCITLACCDEELDYWSAPEEFFPLYYYYGSGSCHVQEV